MIRLLTPIEVRCAQNRPLVFFGVEKLGNAYFCKLASPRAEISWDSRVKQIVALLLLLKLVVAHLTVLLTTIQVNKVAAEFVVRLVDFVFVLDVLETEVSANVQVVFYHHEFSTISAFVLGGVGAFVLGGVGEDGVCTAVFYPKCEPINVAKDQSNALIVAVHHSLNLSLLPKRRRFFRPICCIDLRYIALIKSLWTRSSGWNISDNLVLQFSALKTILFESVRVGDF